MLPLTFSWQIPTYKMSGLLGSHASPACTFRQLMETARGRVEGLQHCGAGTSHCYVSPRVTGTILRSVLSLSPLVIVLTRTEFTVLILGFLPLAAEMARRGVWGETPRRNVRGFAALMSTPAVGEVGWRAPRSGPVRMRPCAPGHIHPGCFRRWAAFLGARRRDPIGSELPLNDNVSHPIASGLFSPLPRG